MRREPRHLAAAAMAVVVSSLVPVLASADVTKAQCIEANTKGQDLRRDNKLSAAREQLRTCAEPSCPGVIRDDCSRRLDELDRAQPTVVFETKDGAGKDLTAVKVSIDGKPLADGLTGAALAVDPGAHTFTFEVAGQAPISEQLVLHEGEKGRTERVMIGAAAPHSAVVSAPPPPTATEGTAQPAQPPATAQSSQGIGSTQRTIGLVVGGVGVASVVVGAIFGGLSMTAHSSYEQNCGGNIGAPAGQCNAQGVSGESDAANKGNLSTIFFVVGGVAAAAGGALFFLAPSSTGAQVGVGPGTFVMRGRF
jgi:hypothetical protein